MDESANLRLPFLMPAQAQKHITHNEALARLDALVQLAVLDRDLASPPAEPAEGDRHIVAAGATGDWAGWDLSVAAWVAGAWQRLIPRAGWLAFVLDEDTLVYWDGAAWQPYAAPSGARRDVLTADRTYYVRTDGSDSNNGLSNSAGGAWATMQKAMDFIAANLDLAGYAVTVQVGPGTYSAGVLFKAVVGQAGPDNLTFLGDLTTPSNVVVNIASGSAFYTNGVGIQARVRGMKLTSSGSGNGFRAGTGSFLRFTDIDFGATGGFHIQADTQGTVQAASNYSITGSASRHMFVQSQGQVQCVSRTITLTGTPAFTQFADLDILSLLQINGCTFTGAATGKRYDVASNSAIFTNGAGATYLPGDTAGSTATGGLYI
ncbi:MAG TPA: DUF2793 domain-containing protein [Alphaproteobacteria bacterium]|nr:DUF2793 domain-containing protein [Alphaproteobacteria bacterium]